MAMRLQSSLAVEGELSEDGLAAYGGDGDDLMMALACKAVIGDGADEAETREEVFAQGRRGQRAGVPGGRPVEGNGHHAGGIGPTVELVLDGGQHGNGHEARPVNDNGHRDEAPEPQQTLFSWAEFMAEEPVKANGRGRKAQPEPCPCSIGRSAYGSPCRTTIRIVLLTAPILCHS